MHICTEVAVLTIIFISGLKAHSGFTRDETLDEGNIEKSPAIGAFELGVEQRTALPEFNYLPVQNTEFSISNDFKLGM